jgi:uncharacterized protein YjbI with pentapeptide repeats/energy-coupling factor transporter ATP-binding protein EcfA2
MAVAWDRADGSRDAGVRVHGRGDLFPWLWAFIGAGVLVGASPPVVVAGLQGRLDWPLLLTPAGLGAGLGAIVGLFLGLGQGVWRPGPAIRVREPDPIRMPQPAPSVPLWDPWLDQGHDLQPVEPEDELDAPVIPAEEQARILARAAVRPRVISPATGEAIRLEDEIGPMVESGQGGLIVILGGPGSGKTTALQHLAAILPPWARARVRMLEVLDLTEIASAGPDTLFFLALDSLKAAKPGYKDVVLGSTGHELAAFDHLLSCRRPSLYRLAPWDQDDAIEYLLATDREACASVMGRLRTSRDLAFLDGIPELCSVVLDRMARDESIGDARAALRRELKDRIGDHPALRKRIEEFCLDGINRNTDPVLILPIVVLPGERETAVRLVRLVRHRPSALLLAADGIAAVIESGSVTQSLVHRYPRELVLEVARQIAGNAMALEHLAGWLKRCPRRVHPLAASLLHAATPGWRPDPDCRPRLEGAYLDGIAWPGQNLAEANLRFAELRHADLSRANLERACVQKACLSGANLQEANLREWIATEADLGGANLSRVQARGARLRGAKLSRAILVEANLRKAYLTGARIDGADFTSANLEGACLKGLPLRLAQFDGARFGGANLSECDLESMVLIDADFHDADLRGSLLTASRMPDANFVGANLRNAKLAEIAWPGAKLLGADLHGANFHLGTTRSGLVGSPVACEGSRTGFYTDDDLDLRIRPAEEIRKANLRGADLRGANIKDVDFYLVDLRGARYTTEQAAHLHRCRAILDDHTA